MDPTVGRLAFTTGFIVFILSLLILPTLDADSPEFVADVLAMGISGIFLLVVIIMVRRSAHLPDIKDYRRKDKDKDEEDK